MKVSQELSPTADAVTSGQSYTPGPWVTTSDEHYVSPASNVATLIAIIHEKDEGGEEERRANACLIAAAPDLLEALRELHLKTVIGTDAERHAALYKAWAAISKAEGK